MVRLLLLRLFNKPIPCLDDILGRDIFHRSMPDCISAGCRGKVGATGGPNKYSLFILPEKGLA
jgi:hypothetical protein